MFKPLLAAVFAVATLAACAAAPLAHANPTAKNADNTSTYQLPPFPATAHRGQTTVVNGRTLKYAVTVGWLPVRDDKSKTIAQVVYTAYTMPGKNRPVTFALNDGPGRLRCFSIAASNALFGKR